MNRFRNPIFLVAALAVMVPDNIHAGDPAPPEGFRAIFNGKDL